MKKKILKNIYKKKIIKNGFSGRFENVAFKF